MHEILRDVDWPAEFFAPAWGIVFSTDRLRLEQKLCRNELWTDQFHCWYSGSGSGARGINRHGETCVTALETQFMGTTQTLQQIILVPCQYIHSMNVERWTRLPMIVVCRVTIVHIWLLVHNGTRDSPRWYSWLYSGHFGVAVHADHTPVVGW